MSVSVCPQPKDLAGPHRQRHLVEGDARLSIALSAAGLVDAPDAFRFNREMVRH
jgi:hypothetical protein